MSASPLLKTFDPLYYVYFKEQFLVDVPEKTYTIIDTDAKVKIWEIVV